MGCGEADPKVYKTDCPQLELEQHVGYLSIEDIEGKSYVYWGCVGEDCGLDTTSVYDISVSPMGEDILRVSCGVMKQRVDRVNVVIIK